MLTTADAFEHAKREAIRKKINASVLGCFVESELNAVKALPPEFRRHLFRRQGLLVFVRRINVEMSNIGAGQM